MSEVRDRWAAGSTYEDFMGRWSRKLAPVFVSWLDVPPGIHWLDVGCGTGSLSTAICEHAAPASVMGCDPAEPFVEYARQHSADPRATFSVAGAGGLPSHEQGYGSVSSLLVLNFVSDKEGAVNEMRLLSAPGGTVSACVWDYAEGLEFLRTFWDAAKSEDPAAAELDEGTRFPICQLDPLQELFSNAGLHDVRCEAIEVSTVFSTFDDFWSPFLGGTGPAPSYVASLNEERRNALAARLDASLPRRADGVIALRARAWAVRGIAPTAWSA